jgi:hypothetical protein
MTARSVPRGTRPSTALVAAALVVAPLALTMLGSCARKSAGSAGTFPGLADLAAAGESVLFARRFPLSGASLGADDSSWALVMVVRMADGHEEMRIGEAKPSGQGFVTAHTSRPGDEFRNLAIEDINADDRPEIVGRWSGGQLEVVEVVGRLPAGGWKPLLVNAGQTIEERRQPDRTVDFWITSRTYDEPPGLPPVYETRVWRWDGAAFTEAPR